MSTVATAPRRVPTEQRRRLALAGLALSLAAFASLAVAVAGGPLAFDLPLLGMARDGGGRFDAAWVLLSRLGHGWGVVPVDVALVCALLLRRRWRGALFAGVVLGGSGLLNLAAKQVFARPRPDLWASLAPEHGFGFPSGHAMGAATLAWVLALMAWPTRWRWPVVLCGAAFAASVGWSRVHLGVHYPSDVVAGWLLATAWVAACWLVAGIPARRD